MTASPITAALKQLDPQNDNHWTDDGLPRVDTVKFFAKDQTLTRDDITKAAPDFSRTVPLVDQPQGAGDGSEEGDHGASGSNDQAVTGLEGLEAELAEAQKGLDAAIARRNEAEKEHAARRAEVDRCLEALDAARPSYPLQGEISGYLKAQQKRLADEAEKQKKFQSIGGMDAIKAILPTKAPIDAARARR